MQARLFSGWEMCDDPTTTSVSDFYINIQRNGKKFLVGPERTQTQSQLTTKCTQTHSETCLFSSLWAGDHAVVWCGAGTHLLIFSCTNNGFCLSIYLSMDDWSGSHLFLFLFFFWQICRKLYCARVPKQHNLLKWMRNFVLFWMTNCLAVKKKKKKIQLGIWNKVSEKVCDARLWKDISSVLCSYL